MEAKGFIVREPQIGATNMNPRKLWTTAREAFSEWRRRRRSRHELMKLSDRELWDLSWTRSDAHAEAVKPFWRG